MHTTVFLELIASLKIIAQRAVTQDPAGGIFTIRNLPLGALVLTSIVLLEMSKKKVTGLLLPLTAVSAVVFLVSSFYLPPEGHSHEAEIVLAYCSLLFLFSAGLVAAFSGSPGIAKILLTLAAFGILSFLAGFINTFHYNPHFRGRHKADVAVVLGGGVIGPHSPAPDLKARLNAAAELYRKGEVERIAVTGGTRRFHTYESEIGAWYLHSIGIPDSVIITEDETENTIEQVLYAKRYLIGKLGMKSVVIVSDGWHLPRALFMCMWSNVKAKGYASHYKMPIGAELFWRLRESAGLQAYMLFGG